MANNNKLSDGRHLFKVRAIDAFGNAGPTQDREILIDTKGPEIGTISFIIYEPGEIPGLSPNTHWFIYIRVDKVVDKHSGLHEDGGKIRFKLPSDEHYPTSVPIHEGSLGGYFSIGADLPETGQVQVEYSDNAGNMTVKNRNIYLSSVVTSEGTNVGNNN